MNATTELRGIAAELLNAAELDAPDEPQDILRPNWSTIGNHFDWRKHIPDAMRDRWLALSSDARVAAYVMAEMAAELAASYDDLDYD